MNGIFVMQNLKQTYLQHYFWSRRYTEATLRQPMFWDGIQFLNKSDDVLALFCRKEAKTVAVSSEGHSKRVSFYISAMQERHSDDSPPLKAIKIAPMAMSNPPTIICQFTFSFRKIAANTMAKTRESRSTGDTCEALPSLSA